MTYNFALPPLGSAAACSAEWSLSSLGLLNRVGDEPLGSEAKLVSNTGNAEEEEGEAKLDANCSWVEPAS